MNKQTPQQHPNKQTNKQTNKQSHKQTKQNKTKQKKKQKSKNKSKQKQKLDKTKTNKQTNKQNKIGSLLVNLYPILAICFHSLRNADQKKKNRKLHYMLTKKLSVVYTKLRQYQNA